MESAYSSGARESVTDDLQRWSNFYSISYTPGYPTWLGNGGNNLTGCCGYRLLFSIFQFVLTLSYIILYKVVVEALPHVQNSTFEDKPGLSTGHQTPLQVSGKIILYKNSLMLLILVNVYIEKETH